MQRSTSIHIPIPNRYVAGRALASMLLTYKRRSDTIILALPRGGVPVAYEVAKALELPMDLLIVRKLGVPFHDELAMGAIAGEGAQVLNHDVVAMHGIDDATLNKVAQRELLELRRRERLYRGNRPLPNLSGKQVILVDDGLATGATMRAAVRSVRSQGAARVVVVVPVAASDTLAEMQKEVDEVVCPFAPEYFTAVGRWYVDFSQVTDQEVIELLQDAWRCKLPGLS